jgi:hypothetical protein
VLGSTPWSLGSTHRLVRSTPQPPGVLLSRPGVLIGRLGVLLSHSGVLIGRAAVFRNRQGVLVRPLGERVAYHVVPVIRRDILPGE